MDHNDLKCFSEAYQIKALKQTVCEMEAEDGLSDLIAKRDALLVK